MRIHAVRPLHVRFELSPARECLRAIAVMLNPSDHAEQMPWIRDARRRRPRDVRAAMEYFRFFFSPSTELFSRGWSGAKKDDFKTELEALRSSPELYRDAVLRRLNGAPFVTLSDLQMMRQPQWYEPAAQRYASRNPYSRSMLQRFVESPETSLKEFCDMLADFHERVVLPTWGSIHKRLLEDIAARRRVFHTFGLVQLLRTLSADISVTRDGNEAAIDLPFGDNDVRLDARGRLILVPSFFCWPKSNIVVMKTPPGMRTVITYPLPPLPAKVTKIPDYDAVVTGCAAIGDQSRLRILELLNGRELSTRELAGYLGVSEPVVSRQLHRLSDAGLVSRRRSGYFVMYSVRRETMQRLIEALSIVAR